MDESRSERQNCFRSGAPLRLPTEYHARRGKSMTMLLRRSLIDILVESQGPWRGGVDRDRGLSQGLVHAHLHEAQRLRVGPEARFHNVILSSIVDPDLHHGHGYFLPLCRLVGTPLCLTEPLTITPRLGRLRGRNRLCQPHHLHRLRNRHLLIPHWTP